MVSKLHQEFLLVLLWSVLILATDDSSKRLQDSIEVSDGFIFFANLFPFPHHKLDSRLFETRAVNTEQDCIEICSKTPRCRSLNFKHSAEESGIFDCHLLDDSKLNSSALFEKNEDYHHYSLAASCEHNPCKNGGTCYPVLEKYDFSCSCMKHFGGKKCDLLKISQGSNICTKLLENGSKKSGVYQVVADGIEIISIFCDQTSKGGGWTMVFKLVSGVSTIPHELWTSSNTLNEDKPEVLNTKSNLKAHYKNRIVANWQTVNPTEARVALYTGGSEDFSIFFNSTNSDNINWFSETRVTDSPWTDLNTEPHYHFSIEGCCDRRDFYIVRNHGGCREDAGWLATTSTNCDWEKKYTGTTILYSKLRTYSSFSRTENFGIADVMVVYIR